jgi:SAM-dependent methyltransferase
MITMTWESDITRLVSIDKKQSEVVRSEWPMPDYIDAWRVFRNLSDENEIMASTIAGASGWPSISKTVSLADLGCGDGRLSETLVRQIKQSISHLYLIDPDEQLLSEAEKRLKAVVSEKQLSVILDRAESVMSKLAESVDAAILCHVVYLLPNEVFRSLLEELRPGLPLFIIMDHPSSVFTRLWSRTAPKYFERLRAAHSLLDQSRTRFDIKSSQFFTHAPNPFGIPNPQIQESLLSILCYSDFPQMDVELRAWVKESVLKYCQDESLECSSVLYEVVKR